ncbi:MAG: acetylglutamate kinase [Flavisolibacter sp.]|nr:acetylglutamate kinase [Flavisolibacter sp.]MBD0367142.1 acetylglutamate kinase [Flavisolibacter sp.]
MNNQNNKATSQSTSSTGGGRREVLFIIKIGGNIIDSENALSSFLNDFASISSKKILVHGGGKLATKLGEQLGIPSNYINGRRITDDATIDLVTMVYGGLINKKIVAQLQTKGCNAIGLTGADGNLIPAQKRPVKEIDYGWVGDVESRIVKAEPLTLLLEHDFVPVFAPLTHDEKGHILNTNADTIASVLAVALSSSYTVRLIYCFEKKGVLNDVANEDSVLTRITRTSYQQLLQQHKLADGILPKLDNAFAALESGVAEIVIGHAADLLHNTTEKTAGTLITP